MNLPYLIKTAIAKVLGQVRSGPFLASVLIVGLVISANVFFKNSFFAQLSLAQGLNGEDDEEVILEESPEAAVFAEEPASLPPAANLSIAQELVSPELGELAVDEEEEMPLLQDSALLPNIGVEVGQYVLSPEGRREIFTYAVEQGDNPALIAKRFGISVFTVLWANNLKEGDTIRPGQQLVILPVSGVRHKVAAKETLSSIAKKYRADLGKISEFNNLTADSQLETGQFLIVPDGRLPAPVRPKYAGVPAGLRAFVGELKSIGDYFIFPTTGRITQGLHSYNAVDIANPSAPPIYAAAAGLISVVDGSGWNGGYGRYVRIKHANGTETVYGHLSQIYVEPGEPVAQGQIIGQMGRTGRATGIHLHWEVRGAANPLARYR